MIHLSHNEPQSSSSTMSQMHAGDAVTYENMMGGSTSINQCSHGNCSETVITHAPMATMRQLLTNNIGRHVIANFLVGTENRIVAEGILSDVGSDYIVLYDPITRSYISADFYSLKFIEFVSTNRSPLYHDRFGETDTAVSNVPFGSGAATATSQFAR